VGIGELTKSKHAEINFIDFVIKRPSKFKYEALKIIKSFIKFPECQVPLAKFTSPIQDFLATVLVFKPHIFSRDSLVTFYSYQSEKVNTPIVNLTVTTIWVRFT